MAVAGTRVEGVPRPCPPPPNAQVSLGSQGRGTKGWKRQGAPSAGGALGEAEPEPKPAPWRWFRRTGLGSPRAQGEK